MMFPGSSGDAPGRVSLIDSYTGTVLRSKAIEMVNMTPAAEWTDDGWVRLSVFAEWKLPDEPVCAEDAP